jgi:DNA-binding NarL/FixJ family response regulator
MKRARILVVDDHELFRESLVALLALESDLEVVGQASDGLEAYQLVRDLQPALTLMDISMPVCGGIEATERIRREFPTAKIMILSISHDDKVLFDALRAGALGFIVKDSTKAALLHAIREVLDGGAPLSPSQTTSVLRTLQQVSKPPEHTTTSKAASGLTPREHEVLGLIVTGATNEEIATQLAVSLPTVKSHVQSIMRKLGADSRREARNIALQRGLIRTTS